MDRLICAVLLVVVERSGVGAGSQASRRLRRGSSAANRGPSSSNCSRFRTSPPIAPTSNATPICCAQLFLKRGFAVEVLPTDGNPLVFAELAVTRCTAHDPVLRALRRSADRSQGLEPDQPVHACRCGPAGWRTAPRRFLISSR
jgi:hypothetical protein